MHNFSDEKLVELYLNGDVKSLEVLIKNYLKPLYSFVYRYVGSAKDAEDITQEVFVKVWRNIKKFKSNKSFKTWIFCIAKNRAIDFLRKKKPELFSEFENENGENVIAETITEPLLLPQEIFERKEISQILACAMEKLSSKYRMVLFLYYNDHFTFREIAETLEENCDTIKSRHRRALIQLKELLSDFLEPPAA